MNNTLNDNHSKRYHKKYKYIKKKIKSLIIENAALCDEVAKTQENIFIVKDERKFLLRKLLEYENEIETCQPSYRYESNTHNGSKARTKKMRNLEDDAKNHIV